MVQDNAKDDGAWTTARLLTWTREHLQRHGLDEPRLAAEILLAHALSCRRIELYTRFDQVPEGRSLDAFRELVKKAAALTPVAYLVGVKEFYSLEFEVTPAVLIPRPETEILAEKAIDYARTRGLEALRFLDLGAGSGCITVAVLKNLPNAAAVASDSSAEALEVAGRNAARHGVADRVRFVQADRLLIPPDAIPAGGFDALLSNPPYVALEEMPGLPPLVRNHEPKIALSDGADGLSFYRTMAAEACALLKADAAVFVEIPDGRAGEVRRIFASPGRFKPTASWRDGSGHERVLCFRRLPG